MLRSVAAVPVRMTALSRIGEGGSSAPGTVTLEQPGGKGGFKLDLDAAQCCGLEGAGDLELQIRRKVQDLQHA